MKNNHLQAPTLLSNLRVDSVESFYLSRIVNKHEISSRKEDLRQCYLHGGGAVISQRGFTPVKY